MVLEDFDIKAAKASESCHVLAASICKLINADAYTIFLAVWITLQLTWVSMLIITQLVQVSRALTTYENMTGVRAGSGGLTAFTSTGTPLDPNHPSLSVPVAPDANAGHKQNVGTLKRWSRLLGVDPFIETIAGRSSATAKSKRKKKNPYSRGCIVNCKDFWCDPSPVFGQRENGSAVLGGDKVDYTDMYETPTLMRITGMRSRGGGGGYEAVGTEEV